jgi:hypothetical protein
MQYRWWSDVQAYPSLDGQTKFGPTYLYEYSTHDAYGSGISWGSNDPLNVTWWHHVTERASHLSPSYLASSDSIFSASRDGSECKSCLSARILASLNFAVDQLSFLSNRHSLISKANNPCARSHATPLSVSMRRYVICVAAR